MFHVEHYNYFLIVFHRLHLLSPLIIPSSFYPVYQFYISIQSYPIQHHDDHIKYKYHSNIISHIHPQTISDTFYTFYSILTLIYSQFTLLFSLLLYNITYNIIHKLYRTGKVPIINLM